MAFLPARGVSQWTGRFSTMQEHVARELNGYALMKDAVAAAKAKGGPPPFVLDVGGEAPICTAVTQPSHSRRTAFAQPSHSLPTTTTAFTQPGLDARWCSLSAPSQHCRHTMVHEAQFRPPTPR